MPEVAEVEASGDTLRIYGELRAIGGYELVPLFYRVLATDPAALCWAWHVLRPAFRSGVVAARTSLAMQQCSKSYGAAHTEAANQLDVGNETRPVHIDRAVRRLVFVS